MHEKDEVRQLSQCAGGDRASDDQDCFSAAGGRDGGPRPFLRALAIDQNHEQSWDALKLLGAAP